MRYRHILLLLPLPVLAWAAIDLSRQPSGDLRSFDPKQVARLETEMWKSYYDRRPLDLFRQLSQLVRSQYHLPLLRSYVTAYHASRAAFAFKDGKSLADYEKALPDIEKFYTAILGDRRNAAEVARLELDWWIVHRERDTRPRTALNESLAKLQAALYGIPAAKFDTHARLRAEAMLLRDGKAANGGPTVEDWKRIESVLQNSWAAHWHVVQEAGFAGM